MSKNVGATALPSRLPDIGPEEGDFVWSRVPEFALAYNGYSVMIPSVEYFLNNTMRQIAEVCAERDPGFREVLVAFIRQEVNHTRIHNRYNKRIYAMGIEGLEPLVKVFADHLTMLGETRSLAFKAAYCAGFESVATYAAVYLFEKCDAYFEGAGANGANLLLWHVAEEFEHRSVCHDAFDAISGNYFVRIHGLLHAFSHVGAGLRNGEKLMLKHYCKNLSSAEQKKAIQRSKRLFLRKMLFIGPRMLKIFLPWYHPSTLKFPERVRHALEVFSRPGAITRPVELLPTTH